MRFQRLRWRFWKQRFGELPSETRRRRQFALQSMRLVRFRTVSEVHLVDYMEYAPNSIPIIL